MGPLTPTDKSTKDQLEMQPVQDDLRHLPAFAIEKVLADIKTQRV